VVVRTLKVLVGALLVLAGTAMLVLPGPGLLAIAGGVALILSQSAGGRRALVRLRLRLRARFGSARVRQVEARLPDEVCPPDATERLRAIADGRDAAPPTLESR
jgi:hypothetical protein